ncbi:molybdenum cofactor sulfurase [Colletotrichum truncatum]|uniref:Molybdenum cofactor sulfurase n=1 Tax=Colletotrichum truncatum TaxID=5467 RepID=A0ACC3YX02_COLTU|nr:molybdenum cofactor sulfurase [Colletotrichum truncatum]KAF6787497.1 molybdenum cofactor sulfurase [Colletotrichum truncatum]
MALTQATDVTAQHQTSYNSQIEAIRRDEYPMLRDQVYLDHAGTTLPAKSLMVDFAKEMSSILIGNPHSSANSSHSAASLVEDTRIRVLQFFNADPEKFDVVFVANATAGIKLVADAFRALPDGFDYIYSQSSHTSLVGVREEAHRSTCLDDAAIIEWLNGHALDYRREDDIRRPALFAYPAQSNLDGRRFPISRCHSINTAPGVAGNGQIFTLLDAAAYVSTAPLDLSVLEFAPDFIVLSFYKIFGFPDLGALIVRRKSSPTLLHRRYFGGGTVDAVTCETENWHARKTHSLHEALEDGTLPVHSIVALGIAIETHDRLFGTMLDVSRHTSYLAKGLRHRLRAIRHRNGKPVCVLYHEEARYTHEMGSGPVVAFNLQAHDGTWVSLNEFQKLASLQRFHIRTGGLCNPGGISATLNLTSADVKGNYANGFRCGDENDLIDGKPTGLIRVSLGAMSTESDVDKFVTFIQDFYSTKHILPTSLVDIQRGQGDFDYFIEDIIVYPIKSCSGFHVPKHIPWQVRAEGLMWDREWCLVHCATGRALSQKRYPLMALLHPTINLETMTLKVSFVGSLPAGASTSISVPLSVSFTSGTHNSLGESVLSRVCGDDVAIQRYTSDYVNNFFSDALGVPCVLARHSPSSQKESSRWAKTSQTSIQRCWTKKRSIVSSFPGYAREGMQCQETAESYKLLLSNESPILAVTSSSVRALNQVIEAGGEKPVAVDVFRANIVIGSQKETPGYVEESWSFLRLGGLRFKVLGLCQRCHMVCINQKTGEKRAEPYVTLSKTRRLHGKVWFGIHLAVTGDRATPSTRPEIQVLRVGQKVIREKTQHFSEPVASLDHQMV